jgi:hypothetical protein
VTGSIDEVAFVGHLVRSAIGWLLLATAWLAATPARAVGPPAGNVELWFVNTRALCEDDLSDPQPDVFRWAGDCRWEPSSPAALVASDAATPIVFTVPGNDTDADASVEFAWTVYERLQETGRRCRLIVWSWPADKIPGRPRRDAHIKIARTDIESHFLATFVRRLAPSTRVGMIGYSLGARTIGGTLHLLHGESYAGRTLPAAAAAKRAPMRIALVAGAMDQDALCGSDGSTPPWPDVERILVIQNRRDRVLRWYPRLNRGRGPAAMGFAGPDCCAWPSERLELLDLTCPVGRRHAWMYYAAAPELRDRLPWYAFLE